jgi:hypothetical protein
MPDYKLYRLDGAGQISRAPEFFAAPSDEAAVAEAECRREEAPAELWEGRRLIARLPVHS